MLVRARDPPFQAARLMLRLYRNVLDANSYRTGKGTKLLRACAEQRFADTHAYRRVILIQGKQNICSSIGRSYMLLRFPLYRFSSALALCLSVADEL